jgi:hypothetical protein
MDVLAFYEQSKYDKQKKNKTALTICNVQLLQDINKVFLKGSFTLNYDFYNKPRHLTLNHEIEIDLINGDINTMYEIINVNLTKEKLFRDNIKQKKNDFKQLLESIENGFLKGEKRKNFWGVKYDRSLEKIFNQLNDIIKRNFSSKYYQTKENWGQYYNNTYELIIDFHLDKKGIKAHDNIYNDIQFTYPKKKWLEQNEYKFLPAILDSYGIKSKYLIKELNKSNISTQIKTINYLCKLFGNNYINYLKKIPWQTYSYDIVPNKRIHTLKNESEKDCMIYVILNWEKQNIKVDNLITTLNKLLSVRQDLEDKGMDLKFKAKNDNDFDTLMEMWLGHKKYLSRGYRLRYIFSENFINEIEAPIYIDDLIFRPIILKSEEDFMIEGYKMKNCMSKQFIHAANYIYVSLKQNRSAINLQYRKGTLNQSYGKANTTVKDKFNNAIEILNQRFGNHPTVFGLKEKYDIITD